MSHVSPPSTALPAKLDAAATVVIKLGTLSRAETSAFSRETLKPRYFVLLPKHLAYFAKPAEATVVEARLISDFMHTSLSALRGHGASIPLLAVKDVALVDLVITLTLDRDTEKLHGASWEDARDWYMAIHRCWTEAKAEAAVSDDATPSAAASATAFATATAGTASAPAVVATSSTTPSSDAAPSPSMLHRLSAKVAGSTRAMSIVGSSRPLVDTLPDKVTFVLAERIALVAAVKQITRRAIEQAGTPESGRVLEDGLDGARSSLALDAKRAEKMASYMAVPYAGTIAPGSTGRNAMGQDVAVLRGWLTRPSKGTLGAGQRERYFVLTPLVLAYFSSEKDAGVVNGYLTGSVGLKSTSVFSQAGVGWPLETIVGVKAFADAELERKQVKLDRAMARAEISKAKGGKGGRSGTWSDSDEETDKSRAPALDAAAGGASFRTKRSPSVLGTAVRVAKAEFTLESVRLDAMSPECASTLIEVDLGERTLLLQAWNVENRDLWVRSLAEWAATRRRAVDNAVGFGKREGLLMPVSKRS